MLRIDINILFTVINLVVLIVAMKIFLFKPIHKVLAQRQKIVDDNLADAEALKADAKGLEREYREQLQGIDTEKAAIISAAKNRAANESEKILAAAQEKAAVIVKEAGVQAELRSKEMLEQAQSQLSEIVLTAVSKLMVKKYAENDGGEFYDEFLTKAGVEDHD